MLKNDLYLSASRIKTLKSCSWLYWCQYVLKIDGGSNDGASRGTVCHLVFETLGEKKHKKEYNKIIKKNDVFASDLVKDIILSEAKKLKVDDEDNLELIKDMTLKGLKYDFYGTDLDKPTKIFSELDFDLSKDDDEFRYRILGFIDKLYLYKSKDTAIIRDFKSSKSMFVGDEISDNIQDWMYALAVKEKFPEYKDRFSEFLFLKFMDNKQTKLSIDDVADGVIKMESIDDSALKGFEHELTECYSYVEDFDEEKAVSNLAANKPFPTDNTFSGKLKCGFAKYKGQLKKDGSLMWHCPFRFDFKYYKIFDKDKNFIKGIHEDNFNPEELEDGFTYKEAQYEGCPAWRNSA